MRVFRSLCVTMLLIVPAPAWADFIGAARFNQGTLDLDFFITSAATVCLETGTIAPFSTSCSGSRTVGTPSSLGIGNFSGTAEATGSTSGALSIGSGISLDVWRVNPLNNPFGSGDRYFAAGFSDSTITDTVSILNAGSIANGFLRLTFDIEGSIVNAVDTITLDNGFDPIPTSGFLPFASSSAFLLANGASRSFSGPGVVTLDVPLLFGSEQAFSLQMSTSAAANMLLPEGYRIIADFSNTATLTGALILDANLQVVNGATMLSAGGLEYGDLTAQPAPVPEPSSLSLLALGIAAAVRHKRRARMLLLFGAGRTSGSNS